MTTTAPTDAPFDMLVEKGKVREFATATLATDPELLSGAVSPPTFLVSSVFWSGVSPVALAGFDRRRLLHGEQEYLFHGPPPGAGQRLTGRHRLDKTYERPGRRGGTMRFAVVVTEFVDDSGRLVAEQRMTLVETEPIGKDQP
ncbi:FAS1-like dehydratase domain-containing protein [Arsenicicoccus bolidensis]|uniref:FAS1-like dehydratase domain-containing protein n=1 Tax=Arsenicicoccus bolidensis TaxID=229480 RepID=UPI0028AEC47C|nr:MaoC family dehydratase N-terminal domain-containing protein [Arsenicicoccus bolidensis]